LEFTEEQPQANIIVRYYTGGLNEVQAEQEAHKQCMDLVKDGYLRKDYCWFPDTQTLMVVYHKEML
jgi:hypothetical protein